jgi:hypothetical protein
MALGQSERWITPSDWENNIGHDGQFGDDKSDCDDICFKTETKGREEGKYVPAMQERQQKDSGSSHTHLLACNVMMGQLDLSHTTRAESLGEGIVAENTIAGTLLGSFGAALGMSLGRGKGLFGILAWAF